MSTQNLEKSFKTKDVFAMAFGTMIGWGWIMLSGQWAASAGMLGAILAYVVGARLSQQQALQLQVQYSSQAVPSWEMLNTQNCGNAVACAAGLKVAEIMEKEIRYYR